MFLEKEFKLGREYAIDFTSHASPLSTDEYNLILSRRRFVSVENFLKRWEGGTLNVYINLHLLNYENSPYGSSLATPNVPGEIETRHRFTVWKLPENDGLRFHGAGSILRVVYVTLQISSDDSFQAAPAASPPAPRCCFQQMRALIGIVLHTWDHQGTDPWRLPAVSV
jgi:hypothetical protein